MMTVPTEEAERLAEIFREMLALSETSRSNHSQSVAADDSIESFDTHGASGTTAACAAQLNHSGDKPQDR
jgi:hypothetical protein